MNIAILSGSEFTCPTRYPANDLKLGFIWSSHAWGGQCLGQLIENSQTQSLVTVVTEGASDHNCSCATLAAPVVIQPVWLPWLQRVTFTLFQ